MGGKRLFDQKLWVWPFYPNLTHLNKVLLWVYPSKLPILAPQMGGLGWLWYNKAGARHLGAAKRRFWIRRVCLVRLLLLRVWCGDFVAFPTLLGERESCSAPGPYRTYGLWELRWTMRFKNGHPSCHNSAKIGYNLLQCWLAFAPVWVGFWSTFAYLKPMLGQMPTNAGANANQCWSKCQPMVEQMATIIPP